MKWYNTLDIAESWTPASEDGTWRHVARDIATKLPCIHVDGDVVLKSDREYLAEEFEDCANDPGADANDFDEIMARLYDWADTPYKAGKLCWIKTF